MFTYYVSANGSDKQAGTLDHPFATLQHVHDLARPGDTIYLRGGVYQISSVIKLTSDGTSGNPITVTNYPGEKPVLDASSMQQTGWFAGWAVDLASASWNHIKGIEIRGGPEGGLVIRDDSHDNVIEMLDVHHNGRLSVQGAGSGISMYGTADNNLLLNNDSHDNKDILLRNADGFVMGATGAGNVLRGNRAWNNSDDGFDFWNGAPTVVEGNWAWHNGYDAAGNPLGDGNGFKLGGHHPGKSSGGHTVVDNMAWDNRQNGFDENGAVRASKLYNNTAYDNHDYNFYFEYGGSVDTLANNLSAGTGRLAIVATSETNSWDLPVSVTSSDFASVNAAVAYGSRAADGSLPSTTFLHPALGSAIVDKGTDVGWTYLGSAPDLGSYEAAAGASASSPPGGQISQATATIKGTAANNVMTGTSRGDTIAGYDGNDKLNGMAGSDVLVGGPGQDTFVFNTKPGPTNVDQITDFSVADDTISLENAVFTKLAAGKLPGGEFWIGTAAHDASDRVIYDSNTGILSYDPDGTGPSGLVQIAKLSLALAMTAADVFVT